MMQENKPLSKFHGLMRLKEFNGAPIWNFYKHHSAVQEMVSSISSTIMSKLSDDLKASPFIAIIVDESMDIAIYKKLIVYMQYVDGDGKVQVKFVEDRDVVNGTAETLVDAITMMLMEMDIPMDKIVSLGSDGPAVMTGWHNGVGVRMSRMCPVFFHIHYAAHRLSLAVSQSAKEVKVVKEYQQTIHHVYVYYANSAVRYNELRAIQELLDDTTVTLKEPKAVPWLSWDPAIHAVWKSWPALVNS